MLDEELLKVLIGVVDAELLEAVRLKVLETKDIEHSDCTLKELSDLSNSKIIWSTNFQWHLPMMNKKGETIISDDIQ